jgi:hypothetical protein
LTTRRGHEEIKKTTFSVVDYAVLPPFPTNKRWAIPLSSLSVFLLSVWQEAALSILARKEGGVDSHVSKIEWSAEPVFVNV